MDVEESPPTSSMLYLTMRAKLSGSLVRDIDRYNTLRAWNGANYFDHSSNPFKRGGRMTNVSDERDVQRALVDISLDRVPLSLLNAASDDSDSSDSCLDIVEGISFLSRQRCLTAARSRMSLMAVLNEPKRRHKPIDGRLHDIVDMISLDGSNKGSAYMTKRVVTGPNRTEGIVGPLSANEVAHLLLLAQKLQETNRIDENLEKNIEMASSTWRKTGRVPNVVATSLMAGLYEGKPFQCPTCSLRFTSPDVRQRHMLSHERVRREVLWATMDDWVSTPGRTSTIRSNHKTLVTLHTFQKLLDKQRSEEPNNVKWLRCVLFPRGGGLVPANTDMALDLDGGVNHCNETDEISTSTNIDDALQCLWSWGTMDTCIAIPVSNAGEYADAITAIDYDPFILEETCHKVRFNISTCMDKVPFPVNFSDLARKTCVLCHDALDVEFSTDYNRLVYCKSSCFKFDNCYIGKNFPDEEVSYKTLLSTEGLDILNDPFLVLRKVAALTFMKSGLRYRRNAGYIDWSLRRDLSLIEDKHIVPDNTTTTTHPQDKQCLMDDMILKWKGPFASSEHIERIPNGIVYTHTDCIALILNAHTIRAKQLCLGSACEYHIATLKVI